MLLGAASEYTGSLGYQVTSHEIGHFFGLRDRYTSGIRRTHEVGGGTFESESSENYFMNIMGANLRDVQFAPYARNWVGWHQERFLVEVALASASSSRRIVGSEAAGINPWFSAGLREAMHSGPYRPWPATCEPRR